MNMRRGILHACACNISASRRSTDFFLWTIWWVWDRLMVLLQFGFIVGLVKSSGWVVWDSEKWAFVSAQLCVVYFLLMWSALAWKDAAMVLYGSAAGFCQLQWLNRGVSVCWRSHVFVRWEVIRPSKSGFEFCRFLRGQFSCWSGPVLSNFR